MNPTRLSARDRTAERPRVSRTAHHRGRILIVDDEDVIASTMAEFLEGEHFTTAVASDMPTALQRVDDFEPDLVLCDIQLPGEDGLSLLDRAIERRPDCLFVMITAYATVENAVAAFRRGAHDYLMKPVIFDELLAKVDRLIRHGRLLRENQALRRQLHIAGDVEPLVGRSRAMQRVKTLIRKLGPARGNVLISGESGTGKELVARALHAAGPNPDEPFLAVNCAAIPAELLENQLFGHVRGAFTGADRDRAGLFVAAGRGTIFLDEIGELPFPIQAKLLRAIETREILAVGATRPAVCHARLVAATNKDLLEEVAAHRFREDLYYRLNVVSIHLPPLRDRREDIPELVSTLLARHAARIGRRLDGVDNAAMRCLISAPWRGNVRELDNALERAAILAEGEILTPDDFPPGLIVDADAEGDGAPDNLRVAVRECERQHIRRVLRECGDEKRDAARRLGLGLSSLYRKLEDLGIRPG